VKHHHLGCAAFVDPGTTDTRKNSSRIGAQLTAMMDLHSSASRSLPTDGSAKTSKSSQQFVSSTTLTACWAMSAFGAFVGVSAWLGGILP
jgi:hypothetical protein